LPSMYKPYVWKPYLTALHCTALHCTALHCTALHCTALHWLNWYGTTTVEWVLNTRTDAAITVASQVLHTVRGIKLVHFAWYWNVSE
jgi:hypothetical protein